MHPQLSPELPPSLISCCLCPGDEQRSGAVGAHASCCLVSGGRGGHGTGCPGGQTLSPEAEVGMGVGPGFALPPALDEPL